MVLVDTSVWNRFLRGRTPFAEEMDRLLSSESVWGHPMVFGELLMGDKGARLTLLQTYEVFHQARVVPDAEVVRFVQTRRLQGRGVGWIDAHLLASALVEGLQVWTDDARLTVLADELQVSYKLH